LAFCLFIPFKSMAQSVDARPQNVTNYSVSVRQLKVSSRARAHLERAQKAFVEANMAEALKEIERTLVSDPQCAQALTMRSLIRLTLRDLEGAATDSGQATALDPNDGQAFLVLATAYNARGETAAAITAAQQALRLSSDLWQARLEIAKALYQQGRFEPALHELEFLHVNFPDVHLVRGDVFMMLGRRKEGSNEFRLFLLQAPTDPRVARIQQIIADSERTVSN
jgi:tetratricopeptide (TPR) repeat protein